jgi:hypothetical protein
VTRFAERTDRQPGLTAVSTAVRYSPSTPSQAFSALKNLPVRRGERPGLELSGSGSSLSVHPKLRPRPGSHASWGMKPLPSGSVRPTASASPQILPTTGARRSLRRRRWRGPPGEGSPFRSFAIGRPVGRRAVGTTTGWWLASGESTPCRAACSPDTCRPSVMSLVPCRRRCARPEVLRRATPFDVIEGTRTRGGGISRRWTRGRCIVSSSSPTKVDSEKTTISCFLNWSPDRVPGLLRQHTSTAVRYSSSTPSQAAWPPALVGQASLEAFFVSQAKCKAFSAVVTIPESELVGKRLP